MNKVDLRGSLERCSFKINTASQGQNLELEFCLSCKSHFCLSIEGVFSAIYSFWSVCSGKIVFDLESCRKP